MHTPEYKMHKVARDSPLCLLVPFVPLVTNPRPL